MKPATTSQLRRECRSVIHKVIDDNVFGPVVTLPHGDILELRVKLREAFPFAHISSAYPRKVYREEIRKVLGFAVKRSTWRPKPKPLAEHQIMPSMRSWARQHGLILPNASMGARQ